jgi:hypothetical protein
VAHSYLYSLSLLTGKLEKTPIYGCLLLTVQYMINVFFIFKKSPPF